MSLERLLINFKNLTTVKNVHKITRRILNLSKMYYGCKMLKEYTPLRKVLEYNIKIYRECNNIKLDIEGMFAGCDAIEKMTLEGIDFTVFNEVNMDRLCEGCLNLETVDVQGAKVKDAKSITNAFQKCDKLRQIIAKDMKIDFKKDKFAVQKWAQERKIEILD